MSNRVLALALGAAFAVLSLPRAARADLEPLPEGSSAAPASAPAPLASPAAREAIDRDDKEEAPRRISASALLGFGSSNMGFGVGVRGGYTLPMNVYVGGSFVYHVGTSTALLGQTISSNAYYFAGEGGYDFHVGPVTIRPLAGVGYQVASVSGLAQNNTLVSSNANSVILYPGAASYWNIPHSQFFVGGDMRVLVPLAGESASFAMFGGGGASF